MVKLAVTSDLHFDATGGLTAPRLIEDLVLEIVESKPDALVLAGDIAASYSDFEACLAEFSGLGFPVGVVAGNHDLWRDGALGLSTEALWGGKLEEAAERNGLVWLESRSLRVGSVAVVGSMCWYDYSAVDPSVNATPAELAAAKSFLNPDATMMDWRRRDPDFAAELERALLARLDAESADPAIAKIAVVTHVPLIEAQMTRKPHFDRWAKSNAYFGNLTTGAAVMRRAKVHAIVSGHSHCGQSAEVPRDGLPTVSARVVPSDYQAPKFLTVVL